MSGVVATGVVAHVPTLGRAEITPDFQQTLVQGERALGAAIRGALRPDAWVVVSAHWVSTFEWFATAQGVQEGVCVADEAPNLLPGIPYRYRGDSPLAAAIVDELAAAGVPASRNDSPHYGWDYGTYVPLSHLDPGAEVAAISMPVVIMADQDECLRAGAAIHAAAQRAGRRVVLLASSAFTHQLVRGRHNWPTPERMAADRAFIGLLERGAVGEAIGGFAAYSRAVVAEMNGKALATMLGAARAMAADGAKLAGRQWGGYAQSSGSGNANILVADERTLAALA